MMMLRIFSRALMLILAFILAYSINARLSSCWGSPSRCW